MLTFQKAQRKRAKLRLAIAGPSGSGKTYGALLIAKGLGGRVAVIDTERGSAESYDHLLDFDALQLGPPFSPERYIEAIHAAEKSGYDVLVIDSMTHEWDGAGGCLESNEAIAHSKFRGNTWAAWNETTPRHRAFIDAILQSQLHIVATMRSKTETIQGDDKKIKKLGMKTIQRDGTDYEFTVVFELEHERHYAVAGKDRTGLFREPHIISPETGRTLRQWLDAGVVPVDQPKPFVVQTLAAIAAAKSRPDLDAIGAEIKRHEMTLSTADITNLRAAWKAQKSVVSSGKQQTTESSAKDLYVAAVELAEEAKAINAKQYTRGLLSQYKAKTLDELTDKQLYVAIEDIRMIVMEREAVSA